MELEKLVDNFINLYFKMANTLAKFLSKINNARQSNLKDVYFNYPISNKCIKILDILYKQGYIKSFTIKNDLTDSNKTNIHVLFKFDQNGKNVINYLNQISTSNRRIYVSINSLWKVKKGNGCFIISTPKGIMTDFDARILKLGGELLCSIA